MKWSRCVATICLLSMVGLLAGCSDDDDDSLSGGTVSASQAGQILSIAIPGVFDFTNAIAQLLSALNTPAALSSDTEGLACTSIPGLGTEFLCTVPSAGQACEVTSPVPGVDWQFSNCVIAGSGETLDGTVFVAPSGATSAVLDFDISLDGDSVAGQATIDWSGCADALYSGLTVTIDGVASTLDGPVEICSASDASGSFTMSVSSPPFEPFLATVSVNGSAISAGVDDDGVPPPLYTCNGTYAGESTDVTCFDADPVR
jgi:hypothetical protein